MISTKLDVDYNKIITTLIRETDEKNTHTQADCITVKRTFK